MLPDQSYKRPPLEVAAYYCFATAMLAMAIIRLFQSSRSGVASAGILAVISIACYLFTAYEIAKPAIIISGGNITFFPPASSQMKTVPIAHLVSVDSCSRDVLTFTTFRGESLSISIGRLGKADRMKIKQDLLAILPVKPTGI